MTRVLAVVALAACAPPPRPPLDLPAAMEGCRLHCHPDRGAWRFDGTALACACDYLRVEIAPAPRRK